MSKKNCDICKTSDLSVYVDGRMKLGVYAGRWANLCNPCHKELGCGLGAGLGQMYVWNDTLNQYEKIAG